MGLIMIIECPSCGSTQLQNDIDGFQNCEHCETVFPVDIFEPGSEPTPHMVIRGVVRKAPTLNFRRSLNKRKSSTVFCDYLSFTVSASNYEGYGHDRIRSFTSNMLGSLPELASVESDSGLYGYTHSSVLSISGQVCGRIATGGNRNTIFVELTGHATAWIDTDAWADWLDDIGARISRIDLAHDDYQGTRTVHDVRNAYLAGEFKNRGQNPTSSLAGPWDDPTQWGSGLTYYVGKRGNGKMLRAYDKGKELGDPNSSWVRFEVELRRQKDRPLPTLVLRNLVEVFKGSYAWLAFVGEEDTKILDRVKEETRISYESLVEYAKTAYGKLINVMMAKSGDAQQVVDSLIQDGIPSRLIQGSLQPT